MMAGLTPIVAGVVEAAILCLDAPISFWGGVDNLSGRIIDQSHPQCGLSVAGLCVVVPMIRGSGGTPGSLAFMLKQGFGPAAIIAGKPDINVMTGVTVAQQLYGTNCPVFLADQSQLDSFQSGQTVSVDIAGEYALRSDR